MLGIGSLGQFGLGEGDPLAPPNGWQMSNSDMPPLARSLNHPAPAFVGIASASAPAFGWFSNFGDVDRAVRVIGY